MYGLICTYYTKTFESQEELIEDIVTSGMDPNYEVSKDGKGLGFQAWDCITL